MLLFRIRHVSTIWAIFIHVLNLFSNKSKQNGSFRIAGEKRQTTVHFGNKTEIKIFVQMKKRIDAHQI